ncbi:MAG: N-acetylmuramoyl-L-alanine amidase [Ruminiclostridium sp.]|nr:N-acetylmuramoyl-L-alanine amidase [Ruminiclostridium sp.]
MERGQTVGNDFKNVIYSSNNETASLLLQGAKLEEALPAGSDNGADAAAAFNPLFSEATDATGRTFTLSFPTVLANLGSGRMQINDKILESIEITNDLESQNTLITFNAKYTLIYDITYNPQTDNTEIHIIKPFTQTDKLVVIDPGHGGSDTGAFYAGISEKDLNLKIAMKVNDILKSYGINTYMTRTDDTYIPLHERAGIANNLNAALFLSVHNNSYNTSEYGTETLSYPTAASRQFAGIVQKTLVNALGTKNRGIIDRPNLVVLYETKMPAVIAEIAFITNTGDRKKLQDEQFMDKAAAALADSVLEALDTILIPQENQPAG